MKVQINRFIKEDLEGISLLDATINGDMEIPLRLEMYGVDSSYSFDDEYSIMLKPINYIKVFENKEEFYSKCIGLSSNTMDTHYYQSEYQNYSMISVIGEVKDIIDGDDIEYDVSYGTYEIDKEPIRKFKGFNFGIMEIESLGCKFYIPFSKWFISNPVKKGSIIVGEFFAYMGLEFKYDAKIV